MLLFRQILVSTLVLGASAVSLPGCGQQGPLYLPTAPAAAQRATLPQTLLPLRAKTPAPATPSTPSPPSTPASTPAPQ